MRLIPFQFRLRMLMVMVAIVAVALWIENARRRASEWASVRLVPGSVATVVVDPPTAFAGLNFPVRGKRPSGRAYESLPYGTRVRVIDDSGEPQMARASDSPPAKRPADNRDVRVTVIHGDKAGVSGTVWRGVLRPAW